MTLPPLGNPARTSSIRSFHHRISINGSASFRNTALRIGITEAEVMYAHAEVCQAIAPIELDNLSLWDIVCQHPQNWYLQIGDLGGSIKICDDIQELHVFGDTLLMNGPNWQVNIKRLSECHGFIVGCHNPRAGTRITICDSHGRTQAVMVSTDSAHCKDIKQKLISYGKEHPKLNPYHYYEKTKNVDPVNSKKSFSDFIETCRKLQLKVKLKRTGQCDAQIEGTFFDFERDGRDLYYNLGLQNVMINHDRIGAACYQAQGISIESELVNSTKWSISLSDESDDIDVLAWMDLTEQFKAKQK